MIFIVSEIENFIYKICQLVEGPPRSSNDSQSLAVVERTYTNDSVSTINLKKPYIDRKFGGRKRTRTSMRLLSLAPELSAFHQTALRRGTLRITR